MTAAAADHSAEGRGLQQMPMPMRLCRFSELSVCPQATNLKQRDTHYISVCMLVALFLRPKKKGH
jgi:hypothetical protein